MQEYLSVSGDFETEKIIEKSRFITHSRHVQNEEEAKAFVAEISKRYADATHNCYAYIADSGVSLYRFSDDGEPSGTAGMPMLEVLKNRALAYTAVVVTRYFGGVKLGAGGLVRAYSGCVAEHLSQAKIMRYCLCKKLICVCSYTDADACARFFSKRGVSVLSTKYDNGVTYTVMTKERERNTFAEALTDTLCGKVQITEAESFYFPIEQVL